MATETQSRTAAPRMTFAEWVFLLLLGLIWGGSFFFVRVAVAEVPAFTIVLARVAIAAAVMVALVVALRLPLPGSLRSWTPFLIMAVLNNVIPMSLIVLGQRQIGAGLAAILNATTPIFTVIVANALLKDERMTVNRVIGVVIGLFGVAVIVGPSALSGATGSVWAKVAILGAALSYAFANTWGRRLRGYQPMVNATAQSVCSTFVMLPIAILVDQPWQLSMPSASVIWSIVALGVVCTAFGYILYFRILKRAGASNVSLVTMLVPVSATLLGFFFLGERLDLSDFLGMLLIATAFAAIDGRIPALVVSRLSHADETVFGPSEPRP